MASAIELKAPNGTDILRIEYAENASKTIAGNKLIQQGDFGLGMSGESRTRVTDLDSLTTSGFYCTTTTAVGLPTTGESGYVWHQDWDNSLIYKRQIFFSATGANKALQRKYDNGVWTAWTKIIDSGNMVGSVWQNAGVPTGAVIETGTNANGFYTKFADGTMICQATKTTASIAAGAVGGVSWTYPAVFIGNPTVQATTYSSTPQTYPVSYINDSTTSGTAYAYNGSGVAIARSILVTANGRWY